MRLLPAIHGRVSWLICLPLCFTCGSLRAQQQQGKPVQVPPSQELVSTVPVAPSTEVFPTVAVIPASKTPLSGLPYVFKLERRDPGEMQAGDAAVVSSLGTALSERAALAGFDLAESDWHYRQIVCPAFPDYLLLDFSHGPDPNGSSRFVAVLSRKDQEVRIVSSFAHGLRPFDAAWSKPGTYDIFNRMLERERGLRPMSTAPNWLVIGMCFAELSGDHVQVFTHNHKPEDSLDMLRLGANQPQLRIDTDRSADVFFSDASTPKVTTNWVLHFDRHGRLTSVDRSSVRQPVGIALKP